MYAKHRTIILAVLIFFLPTSKKKQRRNRKNKAYAVVGHSKVGRLPQSIWQSFVVKSHLPFCDELMVTCI
ncbi:hypothetical protein RchiOBHm_Chr1g0341701 [Rosa chinensis]|uniref:Secreted protein n=1 Tax=Rosa chinensis TaxID=74649 RepID=A0A2P6SDU0_ROSCH|nr:hypothetical protein RchiOBHm_Chr1g0341701 [Rosa chinensis]